MRAKRRVYYCYYVLAEEMKKRKIKQRHIAKLLDEHDCNISKKINGMYSSGYNAHFSLEEAIKIQEELFPDMTVNELFKTRAYTGYTG